MGCRAVRVYTKLCACTRVRSTNLDIHVSMHGEPCTCDVRSCRLETHFTASIYACMIFGHLQSLLPLLNIKPGFSIVLPTLWPYLRQLNVSTEFLAAVVAAYSVGEGLGGCFSMARMRDGTLLCLRNYPDIPL